MCPDGQSIPFFIQIVCNLGLNTEHLRTYRGMPAGLPIQRMSPSLSHRLFGQSQRVEVMI
jgi:hypothetical protein